MSDLFYTDETQDALKTLTLPDNLSELLNSDLTRVGEATVLARLRQETSLKSTDFADATAYESILNHIHIRDYLEDRLRNIEYLQMALIFAFQLADILTQRFPSEHYQVIVTTDWESYGDSIIRFVKIRKGQNLLPNDLERFVTEGVLVLET